MSNDLPVSDVEPAVRDLAAKLGIRGMRDSFPPSDVVDQLTALHLVKASREVGYQVVPTGYDGIMMVVSK